MWCRFGVSKEARTRGSSDSDSIRDRRGGINRNVNDIGNQAARQRRWGYRTEEPQIIYSVNVGFLPSSPAFDRTGILIFGKRFLI